MNLYTKARSHINMDRVKQLSEEKIKLKKIADEIREEIREELRNINSPEFSNWRAEECDLDEAMTSAGVFQTTLPAQGDVDLGDVTSPIQSLGSSPGFSQSGNTYTSGPASAGIPPEINGGFIIDIDTSKFDTLVFELSPGNIDAFEIITANGSGGSTEFTDYTLSTSAGRKVLSLKSVDRNKGVAFAFTFRNKTGSGGSIGTNVIRNLTFQRRTPMNVFVGLDSPEAAAFIRSEPIMAGLSAEDRKKKLIDMLDAGDEYLLKQLGIIGSSARPSDTTMPDSWDQAAAQQGPMPTGPSGYKKPGSYDPNKFYNLAPGSLPSPNIPYTGPGQSNVPGTKDYGNVAATYGGKEAENKQKIKNMLNDPKDPFYLAPTGPGQPSKGRGMGDRWLPLAKKKNTPMVAHYEPQGEMIMEKKKKSFKDLTSKIPGYYEGKPAPLGFPIEEPPKMKDGFHPDLVTSKGQEKKSNRFNRLDPASAKAMPPTGNPHIDKKVRAAAKKPK